MNTKLRTAAEINLELQRVGAEISEIARLRRRWSTAEIDALEAKEADLKKEYLEACNREAQENLKRERREHPERFQLGRVP